MSLLLDLLVTEIIVLWATKVQVSTGKCSYDPFYPILPGVAFQIETSHLNFIANQITSFYMKWNTGLKWFKQLCWIFFEKIVNGPSQKSSIIDMVFDTVLNTFLLPSTVVYFFNPFIVKSCVVLASEFD